MRRLRRLAVLVVVFFALATSAFADSTTRTALPDGYQPLEQQLAAGCGPDLAKTITNLTWDIDIHYGWINELQADPSKARTAGTADWHRYWIRVYQHTITLLLRDCNRADR